MSKLIKKVILSENEKETKLIERYIRVYKNRLGRYRYLIVFLPLPAINGKQGLFITEEEVNGIPYGIYGTAKKKDMTGTLLSVEEIPEGLRFLIRRELRHARYM